MFYSNDSSPIRTQTLIKSRGYDIFVINRVVIEQRSCFSQRESGVCIGNWVQVETGFMDTQYLFIITSLSDIIQKHINP